MLLDVWGAMSLAPQDPVFVSSRPIALVLSTPAGRIAADEDDDLLFPVIRQEQPGRRP
jgi:hypothetical protein